MMELLMLAVGLVVGAAAAYLWAARNSAGLLARVSEAESGASAARAAADELRRQIELARADLDGLREALEAEGRARTKAETELVAARENLQEQRHLLEDARKQLTDTFKALSADALRDSSKALLERTDALIKPLSESLKRYEEHVKALESSRQKAYGTLEEQLRSLSTTHKQLQKETGDLVKALSTPQVRGRWGEIGLRRVVELAGMTEHCDYEQQVSVQSEEGRLRPDMVVHLPAERTIVVDAKVSMDAYLDALSADSEEERRRLLERHARQIRARMNELAAKSYWGQFERAPDFVVMFIPGESFFGAAVDHDPTLVEDGIRDRVLLATPTTLIALLRAVAYGWRQEQLAKNAQAISELGRQLYDRLRTFSEHFQKMGQALERANQAFNRSVGSLEARVFPAARRFAELGVAASAEIEPAEPVDTTPRALNPPEAENQDEDGT